uniref:MPN domain-containing protein n=1 Tax=Panagrellus redivivus TaxID=6233 RepID=A0A7E4ZQF4_PANRE
MAEISAVAYSKIVLHAVKYPHSAVRGFLLGKRHGQEPPIIVDVIPALHGSLLSAPLEALLITLDTYVSDHKLQIVGIYFANESNDDKSFDESFAKVAEKLHTIYPQPVALQVDASKLSLNSNSQCLKAFSYENKAWKSISSFLTNEDVGLAAVSAAIESKLYRELTDFEGHLDDPNADVFNTDLTTKIRQLIE